MSLLESVHDLCRLMKMAEEELRQTRLIVGFVEFVEHSKLDNAELKTIEAQRARASLAEEEALLKGAKADLDQLIQLASHQEELSATVKMTRHVPGKDATAVAGKAMALLEETRKEGEQLTKVVLGYLQAITRYRPKISIG